MDSHTAIKVEGLSKRYVKGSKKYLQQSFFESLADGSLFKPETREEFYALKDLSFEVKKGEVIGVIGRNGAGKSTLLRILSGVTTPDEGEVLVNGKVASILEIGTGFHPDLTGRENVYLSGQLMGMTKEEIDEKYDAIVAFSELANFINEPVKHYSNGMYLRLAFSIFTHVNADIILLDEVLSVGDQSFVEKCRQRILDLLQTDITFVIVSHNMLSIVDYSDRIMLLNKGTLTAFEDATKVVEDYLEENRKEKYGVEKKEGEENGTDNNEGGDDYSSSKLPLDLEEVIIHEISARNPKRDNKELYMDEPIRVSFTFTKTSSDTHTGLVFPIRSAFGVFFHCDSPFFNPDKKIEFNEAGKYFLEFEYPPYFLNYGTYYLTVIVGRDDQFLARVEDLYSFKVKNSPYEEEMVYDFPKFPSRHLLDWKCTKLEEVQQ